jgi:hypothetical protein
VLQLGQGAAIHIESRRFHGPLPINGGAAVCPVVNALLGVAHGGSGGLQPLMPQNDIVPEVRDHEEPGAGISDVADEYVHIYHPQGARGLVLRCQVDVAVVVRRWRQLRGNAVDGGVSFDRRHYLSGSQLKRDSWKP